MKGLELRFSAYGLCIESDSCRDAAPNWPRAGRDSGLRSGQISLALYLKQYLTSYIIPYTTDFQYDLLFSFE